MSRTDSEGSIIQRFFDGIEKYTPQIVSWNGGGFDLPVLHYRGLIHGVRAARYWDMGEDDRDFKWNNYISRYHARHLDMMDLLALYQPRANAPLDELAQLMGFPGKLGMDGSQVWGAYRRGDLAAIRNYCETDVVNTYLVFLRFQLMRGLLTEEQYGEDCATRAHHSRPLHSTSLAAVSALGGTGRRVAGRLIRNGSPWSPSNPWIRKAAASHAPTAR